MSETATLPAPAATRPARIRLPHPLAALVAASLLLALIWAFVTPAFQSPDENSHFGYVQALAETGHLPGSVTKAPFSSEQVAAGTASNSDQAAAVLATKMEWNPAAFKAWLRADRSHRGLSRGDGGGLNPAWSNPPLYYAIEAIPYELTRSANLFSRLLALRIVSLLWLALTVSAAWLLAGEVFGRDRLLQLSAASLAGLAPMMSFISASVTPDSMLFAVWGVAIWLGTRILRRGLTTATAAGLFAAVGVAIVVKASSYALLPAALLVLIVGLRRSGIGPLRPLAAAAAGLIVTAGAWYIAARVAGRPAAAQVTGATSGPGLNVRQLLSYVWQFYLPRAPFMTDFPTIAHTIPVYDIWIKGAWASFGWTEVEFRNRVYIGLVLVMLVVIVAAASELWRRRRGGDRMLVAFLTLVPLSLLAGLHWSEYHLIIGGQSNFNQGRYLLPLVGIAGVVVALALRRLPPRWRGVGAGVVIGGLFALQLFSLGLVMERFYA